jgi:hypothetical protein
LPTSGQLFFFFFGGFASKPPFFPTGINSLHGGKESDSKPSLPVALVTADKIWPGCQILALKAERPRGVLKPVFRIFRAKPVEKPSWDVGDRSSPDSLNVDVGVQSMNPQSQIADCRSRQAIIA